MKLLLLLLLVSCASNQKEPWAVGDCVKYEPRGGAYRIVEVSKFDPYYYNMELIQGDTKPKVLTKIPCNSIKDI